MALTTIFAGFDGTATPPSWVGRLAAAGLGGVVLFGRNVDPARGDSGVAELTSALRDAGPHLLVGVDEEGGDLTRLDTARGSSLPGNAALGALDDPVRTERVGVELGIRLRGCGIDLNFAPVADVDTQTHNPVIGVRAFGSCPDLVSRHVAAFVAGQQGVGVAAAAKHFPGHGGTRDDSHFTVPVLDQPLDELHRLDLPPFRAAIKADVKIVMTAHVVVPSIDRHSPATLSSAAVTGLLRQELGFSGIVMTDGLDMHAISRGVGHAEAGVQALLAGVDALCVGGDSTDPELVESMAGALVEAVRAGRLPAQRLAEASSRIEDLRRWCRKPSSLLVPPATPGDTATAAADVARRIVTPHGRVKLDAAPVILELHDEPSPATGDVPWGVGAPVASRMPGTVVVRLREAGQDVERVLAGLPDRPVVLSVRASRRRQWQERLVHTVRALRPDVIVVDHDTGTSESVLGEHYILTHGAARITAEVAADLLTGTFITGQG
ncbi:glycoside hydrolase family 3 protein [Phytoactinopolyspora mesophila]|uniref:Glycoside hydrolase family 3 protein n=1 Tax=Phytoactinopolyspora mesophila TaxID=2650750 RepID=A0A7K3LY20_9ACTN|nr:glycoside hydrolase family 3 protein [Phytoactinopolyspora mesophila]NDL55931.1 glycoside hydrolase family 3 protein [Phytoactinopolyspora mesophila]